VRGIKRSARSNLWRLCRRSCLSALAISPAFAQPGSAPIHEGRSSLGPASRTARLERVEQAHAGYEAFATREASGSPSESNRAGRGARPHQHPRRHPTLRRGDVIVTSEGLMVFRGARRFPYTPRRFRPGRIAQEAPAGGPRQSLSSCSAAPEALALREPVFSCRVLLSRRDFNVGSGKRTRFS
jgi:hypothetical protein